MKKQHKNLRSKEPNSEQDHYLMRIKKGERLYKFYYFRPEALRHYQFEYRILSKEKINEHVRDVHKYINIFWNDLEDIVRYL